MVSSPPENPPTPPSLSTTRWHGTTTGSGLEPIAAPTAWAPPGRPTRRASSPYPTTDPNGTEAASSRSTRPLNPASPGSSDQSSGSENSRRAPDRYSSSWRIASASSGAPGSRTGRTPSRAAALARNRSHTAGPAWNTTPASPRGVTRRSTGPSGPSTTA